MRRLLSFSIAAVLGCTAVAALSLISVNVFLSSHPGPAERASLLRTELRGVSGGRKDSNQFREVRARLSRLPPPRSMPRR
jgi:hypothetical protein